MQKQACDCSPGGLLDAAETAARSKAAAAETVVRQHGTAPSGKSVRTKSEEVPESAKAMLRQKKWNEGTLSSFARVIRESDTSIATAGNARRRARIEEIVDAGPLSRKDAEEFKLLVAEADESDEDRLVNVMTEPVVPRW